MRKIKFGKGELTVKEVQALAQHLYEDEDTQLFLKVQEGAAKNKLAEKIVELATNEQEEDKDSDGLPELFEHGKKE